MIEENQDVMHSVVASSVFKTMTAFRKYIYCIARNKYRIFSCSAERIMLK